MSKNLIKPKIHLNWKLNFYIFLVTLASSGIVGLVFWLLSYKELLFRYDAIVYISFVLTANAVLSCIISAIMSRTVLKDLESFVGGMQEIATGNFDIRLNLKSPSEIKHMADNFNRMATELSSIETLRNDFISNFSHELKTPIVSIRGFAKLLMESNLSDDEKQEYLSIIFEESDRLAQLSTNILLLTKLETQNIIIKKTKFRLDEQIRQCMVLLMRDWEEKQIEFELELPVIRYIGNEDLMQQLWVNLIGNAIKFTPEKGIISISANETNEHIIVTIKDSGIGMDENALMHIYDKFFQVDTKNTAYGNGLGLSIVKRVVDLCEGKIEVESKPSEGSSFTVSLPKKEY